MSPDPSGLEDHVFERFARGKAVEIAGDGTPAPLGRPLGEAGAVRRHQNVGEFVKRKPRRSHIRMHRTPRLPPNVERGAGAAPVAQRGIKRFLVDNRGIPPLSSSHRRKGAHGPTHPLVTAAEAGAHRPAARTFHRLVRRCDCLIRLE
jgi:hypothetical protein